MRTRTKKKYVASDRARRENVPWHILSYKTRILQRYRNDNCWGKNHKEEIHECKKNLCRKEN